MKDVGKLADSIAHNIEKVSQYLKKDWKSVLVVIWMMLVTITLLQQQKAIEEASSYHQVANMGMAVGDIRYSIEAMEAHVEKMQRSVTKLDNTVKAMDTTVNRIHTQVRHTPAAE